MKLDIFQRGRMISAVGLLASPPGHTQATMNRGTIRRGRVIVIIHMSAAVIAAAASTRREAGRRSVTRPIGHTSPATHRQTGRVYVGRA